MRITPLERACDAKPPRAALVKSRAVSIKKKSWSRTQADGDPGDALSTGLNELGHILSNFGVIVEHHQVMSGKDQIKRGTPVS